MNHCKVKQKWFRNEEHNTEFSQNELQWTTAKWNKSDFVKRNIIQDSHKMSYNEPLQSETKWFRNEEHNTGFLQNELQWTTAKWNKSDFVTRNIIQDSHKMSCNEPLQSETKLFRNEEHNTGFSQNLLYKQTASTQFCPHSRQWRHRPLQFWKIQVSYIEIIRFYCAENGIMVSRSGRKDTCLGVTTTTSALRSSGKNLRIMCTHTNSRSLTGTPLTRIGEKRHLKPQG